MEIRNLTSFVHVAELNSFTKAASALGYSQSTVSFQIKQLESELGCLLFERINNTVALTERGRELLEYAQRVLRLTDEFSESLKAEKEVSGGVHIMTSDSLCEDMMLKNYADFHSRFPNISLKFSTVDTSQMFHMLDHNEGDLMLTVDSHVYNSDYIIAKEEPVSMHFVAGADSKYAKKSAYSLKEVAALPFILTEKGVGYRRALDSLLAKSSLEIVPILEIGRTDVIAKILEGGAGVSFLPDFVTERLVSEGKLAYLNVKGASFNIWKQLIYHKNKWLSKALEALIEYIKENEFKS
ncbi:MAG: LysR family transcriptional regulator [Clostridia bacterium]|nr:LysR family transcriptional regulator [Clostridia bacterium]